MNAAHFGTKKGSLHYTWIPAGSMPSPGVVQAVLREQHLCAVPKTSVFRTTGPKIKHEVHTRLLNHFPFKGTKQSLFGSAAADGLGDDRSGARRSCSSCMLGPRLGHSCFSDAPTSH